MINWLHNDYSGYKVESVLINCHYPVTQDSFVLMYGVSVQKPTGLDEATSLKLARKFTEGVTMGFEQDVAIWKNKTKIENPLLCEEDGPVYQLRRWYEQFYVDVADIDEKATARFEFEIDTTKAVEAWQREVDENLARQAEEKAAAADNKTGV
jgi:3-ketosteroid 9alpha-monooxygenase subunit A